MSVFDPAKKKVILVNTPPEKQNSPCLSDDEVLELAKCGKQIEKHYGCPQDVEWAIDLDLPFPENVFILQSRPETVWSQRKKEAIFRNKSINDLIWESVFKRC